MKTSASGAKRRRLRKFVSPEDRLAHLKAAEVSLLAAKPAAMRPEKLLRRNAEELDRSQNPRILIECLQGMSRILHFVAEMRDREDVRRSASSVLANIMTPDDGSIMGALGHVYESVRCAAVRFVVDAASLRFLLFEGKAAAQFQNRVQQYLFGTLHDPSSRIRILCLENLAKIPVAPENEMECRTLVQMLDEKELASRASALIRCARFPSRKLIAALARFLVRKHDAVVARQRHSEKQQSSLEALLRDFGFSHRYFFLLVGRENAGMVKGVATDILWSGVVQASPSGERLSLQRSRALGEQFCIAANIFMSQNIPASKCVQLLGDVISRVSSIGQSTDADASTASASSFLEGIVRIMQLRASSADANEEGEFATHIRHLEGKYVGVKRGVIPLLQNLRRGEESVWNDEARGSVLATLKSVQRFEVNIALKKAMLNYVRATHACFLSFFVDFDPCECDDAIDLIVTIFCIAGGGVEGEENAVSRTVVKSIRPPHNLGQRIETWFQWTGFLRGAVFRGRAVAWRRHASATVVGSCEFELPKLLNV